MTVPAMLPAAWMTWSRAALKAMVDQHGHAARVHAFYESQLDDIENAVAVLPPVKQCVAARAGQ
jgi:hypothetical protein